MDNKDYIQSETNYIFSYDFNDNNIPEEIEEKYYDRASSLLDEYSWNDIFYCWFNYLKANCQSFLSMYVYSCHFRFIISLNHA